MINKVILIGNLGKEPVTRSIKGGNNRVSNFSIATNDGYYDKQDKWIERSQWHNIVAWNNLSDKAAKLGKGDKVYIEGKLINSEWEDDKGKHYKTEIEAQVLKSLMPSTGNSSSGPTHRQEPRRSAAELREPPAGVDNDYDDLPF